MKLLSWLIIFNLLAPQVSAEIFEKHTLTPPSSFQSDPTFRELPSILMAKRIADRLIHNRSLANIIWKDLDASETEDTLVLNPEVYFYVQAILQERMGAVVERYALERTLLFETIFESIPGLSPDLRVKLENFSGHCVLSGIFLDLIHADKFILLNRLYQKPELYKIFSVFLEQAKFIYNQLGEYQPKSQTKLPEMNSSINMLSTAKAVHRIFSEFELKDDFASPQKITARLMMHLLEGKKGANLHTILESLKERLRVYKTEGIEGLDEILTEIDSALSLGNDASLEDFRKGLLGQALIEFFRKIPKADIHHHLDGSISPKVALRVLWQYPKLRQLFVRNILKEKEGDAEQIFIQRIGRLDNPNSVENLKPYIEYNYKGEGEIDWVAFFEKFGLFYYILNTSLDAVRFAAREASLEDFRIDGLNLIEHKVSIVTPGLDLDPAKVLEAIITGLIEAERASGNKLQTGLIPCLWKDPRFILGKKYDEIAQKAKAEKRTLSRILKDILKELPKSERAEFEGVAKQIGDKVQLIVLYEARKEALRQIQIIVDLKKKWEKQKPEYATYLIGIDTVGDEKDYVKWVTNSALRYAASKGFQITEHLGENWHPGGLKLALLRIKQGVESGIVKRIGHATALGINPDNLKGTYSEEEIAEIKQLQEQIMSLIQEKSIHVETNPSSNLLLVPEKDLALIDRYQKHPVASFYHTLSNVSVNTDDSWILHTVGLSGEFTKVWLANPHLTFRDIQRIISNGFDASFIDRESRLKAKSIGYTQAPATEKRFKGSSNGINGVTMGTLVKKGKVKNVDVTFYSLVHSDDPPEDIAFKIEQEQKRFEDALGELSEKIGGNAAKQELIDLLSAAVKNGIAETKMNAEFVFLEIANGLIKQFEGSDKAEDRVKAEFLKEYKPIVEDHLKNRNDLEFEGDTVISVRKRIAREIQDFTYIIQSHLDFINHDIEKSTRELDKLTISLKEDLAKYDIDVKRLINEVHRELQESNNENLGKYRLSIRRKLHNIPRGTLDASASEIEGMKKRLRAMYLHEESLDILEPFTFILLEMREKIIGDIKTKKKTAISILRDVCKYYEEKVDEMEHNHVRKACEDALLLHLDVAQHLREKIEVAVNAPVETREILQLREINRFEKILAKIESELDEIDPAETLELINKLKTSVPSYINTYSFTAGRALFAAIEELYHGPTEKPEFAIALIKKLINELWKKDLDTENVILIYQDLQQPVVLKNLRREYGDRIKAIMCEKGTGISHFSTLAAGEGIVFIGGVESFYGSVDGGESIIIDGESGEIIVNPRLDTSYEMLKKALEKQIFNNHCAGRAMSPAQTTNELTVDVLANADTVQQAKEMEGLGGSGVGLVRTEYLYSDMTLPSADELADTFISLARCTNNSVTIRLFDKQEDKQMPCLKGSSNLCGFSYYSDPVGKQIVITEIVAALRAANVCPNIRIMFPQVSTEDDAKFARRLVDDAKQTLVSENIISQDTADNIKVGFMVETPAAVDNIDYLLANADFVSMGTNDLTSSTFNVRRDDPEAVKYFQTLQPVILKKIAEVVTAVRRYNMEHPKDKPRQVSICGELAHLPEFIPFAIALSDDDLQLYLSMSPRHIPKVKEFIRYMDRHDIFTECGLSEQILEGKTLASQDIHKRVHSYMDKIIERIKNTEEYRRRYIEVMLGPASKEIADIETFWRQKSSEQWKNNLKTSIDMLLAVIYGIELDEGSTKYARIITALEDEYAKGNGIKRIVISMLLAELHKDTKDLIVMDCSQVNPGMIPFLKKIPNLIILGDGPKGINIENLGLKTALSLDEIKQLVSEDKIERTIFILDKDSKYQYFKDYNFWREYNIEGIGRSFIIPEQISRDMSVMQLLCLAHEILASDFINDNLSPELQQLLTKDDLMLLRKMEKYKPEKLSSDIIQAKDELEEIIRSS